MPNDRRSRTCLARVIGGVIGAGGMTAGWGFMAVAALGGCSSPATTSLGIIASDARSGEPLPGVMVAAETCSRDHPFSIASLLGQTGPNSSQAMTDAQGRANLRVLADWPVRLTAIRTGHELTQRWIEVPLPEEVRIPLDPGPAEAPRQ